MNTFMKSLLRRLLINSIAMLATLYLCNVYASESATYTEEGFLSKFSGKSRQQVSDVLGKPYKKDIAVKPKNTDEVLKDKNIGNTVSKDVIEMWYYKVNISYAPKKSFNTSELTFVNDKCVNITFANKK